MLRYYFGFLLCAVIWVGCSSEENAPTDPNVAAPEGLAVLTATIEGVSLYWSDQSASETGYRLERRISDEADWEKLVDLPANTVSYNDNRVQEADRLSYRLRVIENGRASPPSEEVHVAVPLIAPNILLATSPKEIHVNLRWNDLSGFNEGYEVYRHGASDDFVMIGWSSGDTYTDTTIVLNERFTYKVRAVLDTLFSEFSNEAATISPFFAPAELVGTRLSLTSISLTWRDSSRYEEAYELERKIEAGAYATLARLPADSHSYIDTGLTAATTYSYRVRALNERQNSSYSNETRVVTSILSPLAPSSLVAESSVDLPERIALHWVDNATNEIGYTIEMSDQPDGGWHEIYQANANIVEYVTSQLTIEATYFFRVSAFNDEGPSDYSNVASTVVVGIPPEPSDLSVTLPDWRASILNWRDNSQGEEGFRIERNVPPSVEWQFLAEVGRDDSTFADSSIEQIHTYFYRVASFNAVGMSGFADSAGVEVRDFKPLMPSNMAAESHHWSFATISWRDNSDNESGFELERKMGGENDWNVVTSTEADIVAYNDSTVLDGANYLYRVRAFNEAGVSEFAAEAAVQIPERRPPMPPAAMGVVSVNSRQVTLRWAYIDNVEAGFCIQRRFSWDIDWIADSTILPANTLTFTDSTVSPEIGYTYRTWAFNDVGISDYSNEVTVDIPARIPSPFNLTAEVVDYNEIALNWEDRADVEDAYFVERSASDTLEFEIVAVLQENALSYLDTLLAPETTFTYRVSCSNALEVSDYSNMASATTPSLTVFFDDFETHLDNAPPSPPWVTQVIGTSRASVRAGLGVDESMGLNFHDPDDGENAAIVSVRTEPLTQGNITLQLFIPENSWFGVIGGDNSENGYITWQIQFNGDNTYFVRNGRDLVAGEGNYPIDRWFDLEIAFDTEISKYVVKFDGETVTDSLDLQIDDRLPNGTIGFIAYSDRPISDGYVDNVLVRRAEPREAGVVRRSNLPMTRQRGVAGGGLTIRDALKAFPGRR